MHMTLEADYAVRIVEFLAAANQKVDARTISEETHVPLRFALKILRKLVAEGIVRSYKGTQGGYELAKEPQEISLGQVIESVEGPITISRCVGTEEFQCTRVRERSECRFNRTYAEIAQMVRERLYAVHFGE